jgi:phosphate transport system substrate-binding protein
MRPAVGDATISGDHGLRSAARSALLAVGLTILAVAASLAFHGCADSAPALDSSQPSASPPSSSSTTVGDATDAQPSQSPGELFVFTRENFPRMDGSTSTGPLAEAVACVLLGEPRDDVAELAAGFSRTTQAFRNLAAGLCDIVIISEPDPVVFDEMARDGFAGEIEPLAIEALAFMVNADNPVESLTLEQIRGIYSGAITNWGEVGGFDVEIAAFQRNAEAGSQVLMEKLVMDGLPMADAPTAVVYIASGMGDLITAMKGFDGAANAIGYTVFYYAEEMRMAEGLKIIAVEGVNPSNETLRGGAYPFLSHYYTAIGASAPQGSPARVMFEWLLSEEGQGLVEYEGYVSIK